jgi:starch synthase
MKKNLKIVCLSSEVDPFSKTGGLAEVVRSLSRALFFLGHDVIVISPFYEKIINPKKFNLKLVEENFPLEIDKKNRVLINIWQGELARTEKPKRSLPIFFIGNKKYFSRRRKIYGSSHENTRFFLFNLASLYLLRLLNFRPDIIQSHDWHTGLAPYFLKKEIKFNKDPFYKKIATVFTIHNLAFQLGKNWWEIPEKQRDDGHSPLPHLHGRDLENINFAKRGIIFADALNTVSEKYAAEILTRGYGEDLEKILKNRQDHLFGIINGIDYREYNPATDPGLKKIFDPEKIENKAQNKAYLQKIYKLAQDKNIPLIGMTSRITEQKGFELLMEIADVLARLDLQLIIMGDGEPKYINFFRKISKKYPTKFKIIPFNKKRETSIYAGADMLLLPSRFEPCGLNQLISLRYGCIPIVHYIGGLAETITDFNPRTGQGNGFVFNKYNSFDLLVAIVRAITNFKHKKVWKNLVEQGMKRSFSWELPARKYVELFRKAIKFKKLNS